MTGAFSGVSGSLVLTDDYDKDDGLASNLECVVGVGLHNWWPCTYLLVTLLSLAVWPGDIKDYTGIFGLNSPKPTLPCIHLDGS